MGRAGFRGSRIRRAVVCVAGAAVMTVLPASVPAQAAAEPQASKAVSILDGSGVWRALYSWNAPAIQVGQQFQELRQAAPRACKCTEQGFHYMTQYPPAGWTEVDFDDSRWPRRHFFAKFSNGEWDHRAGGGSASAKLRQLSLRGKFTVTDPAKVGPLWLNVAYRGGVIVYLNGKELTRAHLPAGEVEPGCPAEIYPDKAYLKEDGKPWNWWGDRDVIGREAYPLRIRRLQKVPVPAERLRKGTNVLAIEIHAAAYPEAFLNGKFSPEWASCGLIELQLQTDDAEAVLPNVVRPRGLRFWNTSTAETVFDVSWGDPHEALRPILMSGPRNGCCSGRVVVGSDQPMKNLRAELGALTGPAGRKLPASAVRVWYGSFDQPRGSRWGGATDVSVAQWGDMPRRQDDALIESAPELVPPSPVQMPRGTPQARAADGLPPSLLPGALQPVWVVAEIPKDVAAGEYRGTLTVSVEGQSPVSVPVIINVIDWTLPDPADFAYWMGMIQSPQAVAITYDVPLWSDRHCELVGKSLAWVGKLGPKVLYVPLGAESQYGNEQSMVLWVKGQNGSYTHDFSRVEKYLDLALKHMGVPCFVVVGVWDSCMHISAPKALRRDFPRFSVLDRRTGEITNADGPEHGSPESLEFWKPVLTGLRDILAKRGLGEKMLLGYAADKLPRKPTVEVFRKILPQAGWQSTRHGPRDCEYLAGESENVPVMYHVNVWGGWDNHDPACRRVYGWRYPPRPSLRTWLDRGLFDASPICQFRTACEQALLADRRGLGQIGADFWPVNGSDGRRGGTMVGRFPATSEGNLGIYAGQLLYPGPDGPVPTVRYQMMRENIQECEARIFLEKLLLEKPPGLGEPLAGKCQDLLDERTRWHRTQALAAESCISWPYSGWEARRAKLFDAAAEAAAQLRSPQPKAVAGN